MNPWEPYPKAFKPGFLMRTFRLGERITIEKVIFVEIFLLTTLLLALGWYFNREDPLFIKK